MQLYTQPAMNVQRLLNRKRPGYLLTLWLLLAVMVAACTPVTGSGHIISQDRPVADFNTIEFTGIGEVIITQAGTESVKVSADDNVLPLVTTEVQGGQLSLGLKTHIMLTNATVRYEVTVRSLSALSLTGSGNIAVSKLDGDQLDVQLSGSGKISAAGQEQTLTIALSGSGEVDSEQLTSQQAQVEVSGSGAVVVNAQEKLDASISGSGDIEYVGKPQVTSDVSGSGSVSPK